MKKLVILFSFLSLPVFAAPPILETDFLDQGKHMLGGGYNHSKVSLEGHRDGRNINNSRSEDMLVLEYRFGFTKNQMLSLKIPYTFKVLGKTTVKFADGSTTKIKFSNEGLGDLAVEYKFLLTNSKTQRIAVSLGATVPVGDDDPGESEIISNGTKIQSMKKGGVGNGRTDYEIGLNLSSARGSRTFFTSLAYKLNGSKTQKGEKEERGDNIALDLGVLQTIDAKSSLGIFVTYVYFREGKDGVTDISNFSVYGANLAYFYHITKDFILFPQLVYGRVSEQKQTNRNDNSIFKISDTTIISFAVKFKKTF